MGKREVLALLRDGEYVSGEEISKALHISRAAVWKSVKALRSDGCAIVSAPNRGYCLHPERTHLLMPQIQRGLASCPWAGQVQLLEEVDSTNTRAKQLAAQGAPHGTVVIAGRQSGGRGRLGRQFSSPNGGVYLSVLLRPQEAASELLHLTAAVAVAVRRAISDCCDLQTDIKWMNDLLIDGKKVCGILTELATEAGSGMLEYAVIGMGINCNTRMEDFPEDVRSKAASLCSARGRTINPNELASALVRRLYEMDACLQTQRANYLAEYAAACITIGKDVLLLRGGESREAHALGIDAHGGLLVRYADGTTATVNAGEVSVRNF